jgi:hypothetical protein
MEERKPIEADLKKYADDDYQTIGIKIQLIDLTELAEDFDYTRPVRFHALP